jgi:hypothetical protein
MELFTEYVHRSTFWDLLRNYEMAALIMGVVGCVQCMWLLSMVKKKAEVFSCALFLASTFLHSLAGSFEALRHLQFYFDGLRRGVDVSPESSIMVFALFPLYVGVSCNLIFLIVGICVYALKWWGQQKSNKSLETNHGQR